MIDLGLRLVITHLIHSKAAFFSTDKTLRWFDGAATEQSNWGVRKPDMDHLKPHPCVVLRIPEGVWQSTPCEDKTGFICKVEAGVCKGRRNFLTLTRSWLMLAHHVREFFR